MSQDSVAGVIGIEYWADGRGREPVRKYVEALAAAGEGSQVAAFERLLRLLAAHGPAIGMPMVRLIHRQARLYELRFGDHRCAFVEDGGAIVLLHAWRKRTRKLAAHERKLALSRLRAL